MSGKQRCKDTNNADDDYYYIDNKVILFGVNFGHVESLCSYNEMMSVLVWF